MAADLASLAARPTVERATFARKLAQTRRIVEWAANVSRGKADLRQTLTPATFVEGGTIGPLGKGG